MLLTAKHKFHINKIPSTTLQGFFETRLESLPNPRLVSSLPAILRFEKVVAHKGDIV
jgi:hypothetical protein